MAGLPFPAGALHYRYFRIPPLVCFKYQATVSLLPTKATATCDSVRPHLHTQTPRGGCKKTGTDSCPFDIIFMDTINHLLNYYQMNLHHFQLFKNAFVSP